MTSRNCKIVFRTKRTRLKMRFPSIPRFEGYFFTTKLVNGMLWGRGPTCHWHGLIHLERWYKDIPSKCILLRTWNGHWDLGMWLCSVVLLNLNHFIRWHIITLLVIAISIVLPHCLCHIIQLIVSICTQCVGSFINSKWPIVKAFYGSNCLMDRCILCNGQQKTNYVPFVYYRKKTEKG